MKTSELTGAALDWAVAKCEGIDYMKDDVRFRGAYARKYSTDWAQGGQIIEREKIAIYLNGYEDEWMGEDEDEWMGEGGWKRGTGPTPLIAAMRCYVASELGDEVEVPDELLHGESK